MEIFDAYRLNRMLRTADGAVSDDTQLISEIIFTNGMRKVIPRVGNDLHIKQVNELVERVKNMKSDYLIMKDEGNHIILTIDPKYKPTFLTDDSNTLVAKFPGSDVQYRLLPEDKLSFPEFSELIKDYKGKYLDQENMDLLKEYYVNLQKVYDDLDELTNGASRGTLGIVSSYNREAKLISSFSDDVIRNTLKLDYTGDSRLWNHLSFDKSLLGDYENSWKLGSHSDDFDPLINVANTLDEASGRVMTEQHYIDTFFGADSPCKMSSLESDFTNEELLDLFKNSDEYVCVSLHDAPTTTGFEVRELKIKDALSVEMAKRSGAIYVPYDLYLDMANTINNSEITSKFLKIWAGFTVGLKVTQLVHPGTVIRNWIDATYKLAGDEGSLATALGYEFIAAKRLCNLHKIMREAGTDISEATWKSANYDKYMTYNDYRDLIGFIANDSVSGGESARTKKILNEFFSRGKREEALGIDGFKTIGSDIQKFEQAYDEKGLQTLLDKLLKEEPDLFKDMPRDDFTALFNARKLDNNFEFADSAEKWFYNELATKVIDQATKGIRHPLRSGRQNFNKVTGWMLSPMSQTEQIVRYSQLLALRDMGHTNASAYKHIIDTHFNYNNKSMRMKCLEAVVPFATFQYNNLLYWIRQIDENPRLIRWLEETFGRLSFTDIDDMEDEKGRIDKSLEYRIASGGIPLGSGGMYLKLNPSYLDAMNWFYGGPDDFLSNVSPPIRTLAKATIDTMGFDSYSMFDEVQFSHSAKEWMYELSESVPVGNYVAGFVRHFIDSKPWNRVDSSLEKVMVGMMPSLFGAVKTYDVQAGQDFDQWQQSLMDQDKWYDANQGKVVDISEYNEDGLNNPDLTFEQRRILEYLTHGRLYDQNQACFVTADRFISGGLNQDWDFSKEGEWDKYCKLKAEILGLHYDLNTRKFVRYKSLGGLNNPDLDWDTICDLNESMHGLLWDSNQGMFVEKKYYIDGGLNKEHVSFPELCAYMYAIRGKVWDQASHEFVEVKDTAVVNLKASNKYNDWKIFNNLGFDPGNIAPEYMIHYENGMYRSLDGKYVLTDDEISNQRIFDELVRKYSYGRSYHRGYAGGHPYDASPIVPNRAAYYSLSGKKFSGSPVNSTTSAASRIYASGYKAYEHYYSYELKHTYSYIDTLGYRNSVKRFDFHRPSFTPKFAMYTR